VEAVPLREESTGDVADGMAWRAAKCNQMGRERPRQLGHTAPAVKHIMPDRANRGAVTKEVCSILEHGAAPRAGTRPRTESTEKRIDLGFRVARNFECRHRATDPTTHGQGGAG
jgi:hypothetical protein